MEAMGSLTGGLAHDFNDLLTLIIGSLDRLVTRGVGSERERRPMAGALESAERAKTLVQRLLAFARRQPSQAVAADVGRLSRAWRGRSARRWARPWSGGSISPRPGRQRVPMPTGSIWRSSTSP